MKTQDEDGQNSCDHNNQQGGGHNALSLHARIPDMHLDECERILGSIQEKAAKDFGIDHSTVQFERAGLPARSGYVMPEPAKK